MYLIVVPAILCLAAVPVTPSHHEIHKRMTPGQFRKVFGTTDEDVPKYEIVDVEVSHMQKRSTSSGRRVRIRGRNGNIDLSLEPTEGNLATENTPVTIGVGLIGDTMRYEDVPNIMRKVGDLWEDPLTGSSFFLSRNRNRRYAINGLIESRNLVIKSLPEDLDDFITAKNSNRHIVFKSNETLFGSPNQTYHLNETMLQLAFARNKRDIPRIIYPRVLAVVDATSYAALGSDIANTVRYVLQLWNSVDLRYRHIQYPKVRINIARIVIEAQRNDPPYIWKSKRNKATLNSLSVLELADQHFYSQNASIPITSYDVIMIMTQYSLYGDGGGQGGKLNTLYTLSGHIRVDGEETGLAYISGACSVNHTAKTMKRTGVFVDYGDYNAFVPAHELGHLLGAEHDNKTCPSEDNYIMTGIPVSKLDNAWKFSACTVRYVQDFTQRNPGCLTNRPITDGPVMPRFLPNSTLDEQCQILGGIRACEQQNNSPSNTPFCRTFLMCVPPGEDNTSESCFNLAPNYRAEGTPCDEDGKICLQGECVALYAG